MLIFNKNIYEPADPSPSRLTLENLDAPNSGLIPYEFLLTALVSDRQLFVALEHMPPAELQPHLQALFPHASRFGPVRTLNQISKRLLEGLVDRTGWYRMNAYHHSYLYDTLNGLVEEYSYGDEVQRREMFPELEGQDIDLNHFLGEYFLNTAFLIHPDRFNRMKEDGIRSSGFEDPCLFGVINRLTPSGEEIDLVPVKENPYTPE